MDIELIKKLNAERSPGLWAIGYDCVYAQAEKSGVAQPAVASFRNESNFAFDTHQTSMDANRKLIALLPELLRDYLALIEENDKLKEANLLVETIEKLSVDNSKQDVLKNAMQEILSFHCNDSHKPKAFYIAAKALEAVES